MGYTIQRPVTAFGPSKKVEAIPDADVKSHKAAIAFHDRQRRAAEKDPNTGISVVVHHQNRATSLRQALHQLKKETERGEHRPSVGGYTDHKHGGES